MRVMHGLLHWVGVQSAPTASRLWTAGLGAAFGILAAGLVVRFWPELGPSWLGLGLPLLIAPIGASAVLLFAVPASPLAQPWAIVGGNTVSALCGIFWMKVLGDPAYAACLAVASAIVAMSLARCLHPPGGACALTCVIGGKAVVAAGWSFALVPVALDSALLVAFGVLYNSAVRGNYPHRAVQFAAPGPARAGFSMADIESVLSQYDQLLDVSSEDLDTLFRQVETRAYRRLQGTIRCDQIMREDGLTLRPEDGLARAVALFGGHRIGALPVIDAEGRLEGLLRLDSLVSVGEEARVEQVMDTSPCIAAADAPIDELLPILSGGMYHEALVVDARGHLLGMITQTDLLSALWRGHIAEQIALHEGGKAG
ncbi:HPP family protein [Novosphingobium humi]|uniref:HPP family protein n=1 Tax=Novosphingobium humi TaxID=2282397 RepID=A0ABY7TY28_9SPHN|nr:HPP family protein [Novosphingobium humi]WCT76719.1 HPP family protein [Novosphingobium humi]